MNPEHYELEFYCDPNGTEPFREFLEGLSDVKREALESALILILGRQGQDVCGTEFGKPLKGGLFEFRLRFEESVILGKVRPRLGGEAKLATSSEKILLRVFCYAYGNKVILLIGGSDKGKDPSRRRQAREIDKARRLLREFKAGQGPGDDAETSARGVSRKHSFIGYWRSRRRNRRSGGY